MTTFENNTKLKFKGNFGELELSINGTVANGVYKQEGEINGVFTGNTFEGQWKNKGKSGLLKFTLKDDELHGTWKKGLEPGIMKGKWEGKLQSDDALKNRDKTNIRVSSSVPQTISNSLKNNFLFQASLGSKELFHSNLIGWLLEQRVESESKSFILEKFLKNLFKGRTFLEQSESIDDFQILREDKNIDLTIRCRVGGKCLIVLIENKVKSLPSIIQLENYSKKAEKMEGKIINFKGDSGEPLLLNAKVKGKFLLSMTTVNDNRISKNEEWVNITYENNILKFLGSIKGSLFENKDVNLAINRYIDLLENQVALLKHFGLISDHSDDFFKRPYDIYSNNEIKADLESLRLHDLILKLIHHKIAKKVECKVSKFLDINRAVSEFTRSTGITSVDIIVAKKIIVGIQLQGNQFRLYTIYKRGKTNEKFSLKLWNEKLWFYDLDTGKPLLGNGRRKEYFHKLGMQDQSGNNRAFCEYGQGVFLYLYKDLSKTEVPLTMDMVVDLFVKYFNHIRDNIKKFEEATKSQ